MTEANIRYKTRGLPRAPNIPIQPGEQFGEWTAIRIIPNMQRWFCRCSCGTQKAVLTCGLRNGGSKSCGCQYVTPKKHGMAGTSTYMIWAHILQRCNNPKSTGYKHYGGRGITVCKRWLTFDNFFADMGERPEDLSIERKDNDGPYCKDNCVWATTAEQSNNKRRSKKVTYGGQTRTLKEWSTMLGICDQVLYYRHKRGWPVEALLSKPDIHRKKSFL